MAWDKGFNFRNTSGYVTDGANSTYVLIGDAYTGSIIRNSVAFGWTNAPTNGDNVSTGVDVRLAGINYDFNVVRTFRVDLPAPGDYDITLAMGHAGFTVANQLGVFKDNGSTLWTAGPSGSLINSSMDAVGASYSSANWPANNTTKRLTFSSTVLTLDMSASSDYGCLQHLFLSQVVGGAAFLPRRPLSLSQAVNRASTY